MITAADININVTSNANRTTSDMRGLDTSLQKTNKSTQSYAKSLKTLAIGAIAVTAGVMALKRTFSAIFQATEKQIQVDKQLEARLKSTGYAAGLTAEEIKNMAAELQKVTKYGDETIMQGQNLLLTFTKIGKDVFPRATEVMLDMSTALGQDLKSSAIQLGKALNDPVLGVTALRRVGVQLSKEQEKQVKAFMDRLGMDDVVSDDVWAVETGKTFLKKGQSKRMVTKEVVPEFKGNPSKDSDMKKFYKIDIRPWIKTLPASHRKEIEAGEVEAELDVSLPISVVRKDKKSFTDHDEQMLKIYATAWAKKLQAYGYRDFSFDITPGQNKQAYGQPMFW